jgi:hypothetical protein
VNIVINIKRFVGIAAVTITLAGVSGQLARADSFQAIRVTVLRDTPLYYAPGSVIPTDDRLRAGQQWYVVGVDATRKYARVEVTEKFFTWVPVSALALGSVADLPIVSA